MLQHRLPLARSIALGALAAVAAALVACGDGAEPQAGPSITRAQFIDAVVALRNAETDLDRETDDDSVLAVRYEAARDSILAAQDVTSAELEAFLAHHDDLDVQDALWDTIAERLKRPRVFETDEPGPGQPRKLEFPEGGPPLHPSRGELGEGPPRPRRPPGDTGGLPIHR